MNHPDPTPHPRREAVLRIRSVPGLVKPPWGCEILNESHGGPETLLSWLECQLGLPIPRGHRAERIAAYATALDEAARPEFAASLAADRWATATGLLDRRDTLLLSGWNGTATATSPRLVRALAAVEAVRAFTLPGDAERLARIAQSLDAGQTLPPHRCQLEDPIHSWPDAWQRVLSRLTLTEPARVEPSAAAASALGSLQAALLGGAQTDLQPDTSFRQVRTRSAGAAVEFLAAILARDVPLLARTVVVCEDDDLALRLDAALHRLGAPTMGASAWSTAHPVLQVLPLSLAMCWSPVDPEVVLAFLTLPVLPIPRFAARRLAKALSEEPGVGSSEWQRAIAELESKEPGHDRDDGEAAAKGSQKEPLADRIKAWFEGAKAPRGGTIPAVLVRQRCSMVARWAAARATATATATASTATTDPATIEALQTVAGQAALLGELAECLGTPLSEPQLTRLLDEVLTPGTECQPHPETDAGPVRVRSLAGIGGPVDRLIWLAPATGDAVGSLWSASQCRELRAASIDVDDGSRGLSALRDAELRGFCHVTRAALVVMPPLAETRRWHPIWLAAQGRLAAAHREQPPVLEDLIAGGNTASLEPFTIPCSVFDAQPPPPRRALWSIPAGLMSERTEVSASELEDRLACPLKWVLQYQARLRPASTAELPDEHRLKGSFAHRVLEQALGAGGPLPSADQAVARVLEVFDERLPLDAAPLAQPERQLATRQFRRELERSTRALVETLARGGYQIVGFELPVQGTALDRPLTGRIDCLARRKAGGEAVIDFKYGGRSRYPEALQKGTAVQLATYAHGRSQVTGSHPAVAYLILSDAVLCTPQPNAIAGARAGDTIAGPAIEEVWTRFAHALHHAGDWLTSDSPVPARPLQEPPLWPDGATLVLNDRPRDDNPQHVCRYCHYPRLCGLEETR